MEMQDIVTFINGCGFPVAICCFLLYFVKTEIGSLRDVIEKNTIVMEKILTTLGLDSEGKE